MGSETMFTLKVVMLADWLWKSRVKGLKVRNSGELNTVLFLMQATRNLVTFVLYRTLE